MRIFPIHVLIKDLSFWITFFLMVKFINHNDYFFETDWWTGREIIGTSIHDYGILDSRHLHSGSDLSNLKIKKK